jgi:predicted transcriptional regulator
MKRSRDMIISDILDICIEGASKTRIVCKANLNFKTVNPYIELLIKNGLVNTAKEQIVTYRTTSKGKAFLENFKQIQLNLSAS